MPKRKAYIIQIRRQIMSDVLMEKLLGLPEFMITVFKQKDYDMGFYVQAKQRPRVCPACDVV